METSMDKGMIESGDVDSDPTYEAWKLELQWDRMLQLHNSDPTYEAWKHVGNEFVVYAEAKLFRSYLRGMETHLLQYSLYSQPTIPILPTRHGND